MASPPSSSDLSDRRPAGITSFLLRCRARFKRSRSRDGSDPGPEILVPEGAPPELTPVTSRTPSTPLTPPSGPYIPPSFHRHPSSAPTNFSELTSTPSQYGSDSLTSGHASTTTEQTSLRTLSTDYAHLGPTDPPHIHFQSVEQLQRATALFARYGTPIGLSDWAILPTSRTSSTTTQWVEKPVRMRVRRHCHRCQTVFGQDKVCKTCEHVQCKRCHRYPTTRKGKEVAVGARIEEREHEAGKGPSSSSSMLPRLRASSWRSAPTRRPRSDASELVHKPVIMRVHRTCHQCQTVFVRNETTCRNCQHVRCSACPRDPPKSNKWPHGYPGDAEADPSVLSSLDHGDSSTREHPWVCHACNRTVQAGSQHCRGCGHEPCERCIGYPTKRSDPPDLQLHIMGQHEPRPTMVPEAILPMAPNPVHVESDRLSLNSLTLVDAPPPDWSTNYL